MLKRLFLSERAMMMAIMMNAAIIFTLYFPSMEGNLTLLMIDHLFVFFFLVEALVKIRVLKPSGYFASGWNRFDLTLVLLSAPSLLEGFIEMPNTSVVLLLRLFRLIRLIRLLKFVPHISMIVAGLSRAMKASVFVLIALFFLNFMFSLISCHFFRDIAPEMFGNPVLSAYSVFQMFTIEGWNEIPATIAERTDSELFAGFARLYFVIVVLIGGVFGMSLMNAIFVDEMTYDNNQDLELKIDQLTNEISELRHQLLSKNTDK